MDDLTPDLCTWNKEQEAVVLTFGGKDIDLTDEYHVRGGICWPRPVSAGNSTILRGYACIGCQSISDGIVWLMADMSFSSVDHYLDPVSREMYTGLTTFLNKAWTSFMCQRFYFREKQETHRRFVYEVERSPVIRDMPVFTVVYWDNDLEARHLILEARQAGRLKIDDDLVRTIQTWTAQPDSLAVLPEIQALTCMLRGFQEYPWRKPEQEDTIVVVN